MRGAILPIAAVAMLSACATTKPQSTAFAVQTQRSDFSKLSCRQIAAELAAAEQAYSSVSKRGRPAHEEQSAQAFLFPASLGAAPPSAGPKLQARIEDLQRASRAKRCTSALRETGTA